MIHRDSKEYVHEMSEREQAAELFAIALLDMGVIDDVGLRGYVVSLTTHDAGVHLGNLQEDFDADVHLICEPKEVRSGPLAENYISEEAKVYANVIVNGIADDWKGHGLPTHASGRDGARPKDDDMMSKRLTGLAEALDLLRFPEEDDD